MANSNYMVLVATTETQSSVCHVASRRLRKYFHQARLTLLTVKYATERDICFIVQGTNNFVNNYLINFLQIILYLLYKTVFNLQKNLSPIHFYSTVGPPEIHELVGFYTTTVHLRENVRNEAGNCVHYELQNKDG